ncbi:MAG: helix-turn-helix transcriptional regulator, partial [Lachnospiraceae bacterium]|nr:helix-turn-helix transcriptional regulator [Lachnospiraceae bacterium]
LGVSPQQYLLQYRLDMACQLLRTTELPIQDIAKRIGYDNQLTFSKMFKKKYEVSPKQYRMNMNEESQSHALETD